MLNWPPVKCLRKKGSSTVFLAVAGHYTSVDC